MWNVTGNPGGAVLDDPPNAALPSPERNEKK